MHFKEFPCNISKHYIHMTRTHHPDSDCLLSFKSPALFLAYHNRSILPNCNLLLTALKVGTNISHCKFLMRDVSLARTERGGTVVVCSLDELSP